MLSHLPLTFGIWLEVHIPTWAYLRQLWLIVSSRLEPSEFPGSFSPAISHSFLASGLGLITETARAERAEHDHTMQDFRDRISKLSSEKAFFACPTLFYQREDQHSRKKVTFLLGGCLAVPVGMEANVTHFSRILLIKMVNLGLHPPWNCQTPSKQVSHSAPWPSIAENQ